MLVDAAAEHKVISFMNGNAGNNQFFMAEEDKAKKPLGAPAQLAYLNGL